MARTTRRTAITSLFSISVVGCATGTTADSVAPDSAPATQGSDLPPLHSAAARGDLDGVRKLLADGANPSELEPLMHLSALHKAAYSGNAEVARALLDAGAIVDLQAPSIGNTPLHDAISFRNGAPLDLIETLLQAGASLAIRNHPGMNPVELAQRLGDDEVATRLQAEAQVRQPEAFLALMEAVEKNDVPVVRRIVQETPELVHMKDAQGFAPLSRAARTGKTELVEILLGAGADPNQLDRWMGAHAGHKASFWGHADVLRKLVAAKIDLDAQGRYNGYTALHDAVSQRHYEAVQVLVEAGARTDVVAHDGTTARSIAEGLGDPRLLKLVGK